ncbi:benzyl alcohol O-benzoyltransferase-like protein [Tanacetum coccineum]
MAQVNSTPLYFNVRRRAPELIRPAEPTPRELKLLSDIDDQERLRMMISGVLFYRSDPKMKNKNPASVIREALAKVLVYYYPLAGRVREAPGDKLMVDCTGEGVLFTEAEADVSLKQLGEPLLPPYPRMEELLFNVPEFDGLLDTPLVLIQVTRLLCGGFVVGLRHNHTMCDAAGILQFSKALGEIARGASTPSTLPVWQRDFLLARDPPRVTCTHREFDEVEDTDDMIPPNDMIHSSFFFGPSEVSAIRRFVPPHLQKCTTFDIIVACLWRCRTIGLQLDPQLEMRLAILVDARAKFKHPPLPVGYYGNCVAFSISISTVRDLSQKSLGHILELILKAKTQVTEDYMRSLTDLMIIKGRPHFNIVRSFIVTDWTRSGMNEVDFGWGKLAYGGPGDRDIADLSMYLPLTNHKGESGIVVPISLPSTAMEIFKRELNYMSVHENSQVLLEHNFASSKL